MCPLPVTRFLVTNSIITNSIITNSTITNSIITNSIIANNTHHTNIGNFQVYSFLNPFLQGCRKTTRFVDSKY